MISKGISFLGIAMDGTHFAISEESLKKASDTVIALRDQGATWQRIQSYLNRRELWYA